MKQQLSVASTIMILSFTLLLTSCETVGSLMKGSYWAGVISVIVIVAVIFFVIARMGKKS